MSCVSGEGVWGAKLLWRLRLTREGGILGVGDVCGSGKLFGLQWRSGGEGLDSGLSVSECVWVWLVCGEVSGWVEIVGDCSLCVSDLGGLRLSG